VSDAHNILIPAGCTIHLGPGRYGTVRVEGHLASVAEGAEIAELSVCETALAMPTCANCKSWAPPQFAGELLGHCNHRKVGMGGEFPDGAMDAEAYGGIDTGPDFGCLHWEKRE
jgi:hypothetical protein